MSISVERLRIWLLAGAGLLVVVIVAFLGYAHHRTHRFLAGLPKKLGIDIRRETNNVTLSQSVEGRTIYTLHAARQVEHADGKMTLHDVGIVLYGRHQDRADRIYGKEFEYDQKNGVVRAVGEVHIDLEAPQAKGANAKMDYAAGKDLEGVNGAGEPKNGSEKKDARLIHVTTSGLVFLQKLGVAATDKDIEFESGGMTGHAVGADYSSDTGVVVLHSAVRVNGLQHGRPVLLTASNAVLDRQGQTIVLSQARYMSVGAETNADHKARDRTAVGQTAQAQHVVVHLRRDGSAERVEAEGEVTLADGAGGSVVAPRGEMALNEENQPQSTVLSGGVKYAAEAPLRHAHGEAAEARAAFDKRGHPEHVVLNGAVNLVERVRAADTAESQSQLWNERELSAGTVELALSADAAGKAQLQDAKAAGDARLKVVNVAAKPVTQAGAKAAPDARTTTSALAGDVLTAHFTRVGAASHIAEVHGDGHTMLRRVSATGAVNTGSADSLVAHFRPAARGAGKDHGSSSGSPGGGGDEVSDATEQGHVVMTRLPARKPGDAAAPLEERATADRGVYENDSEKNPSEENRDGGNTTRPGSLEQTTLTGNVQVSDGTSVLWADRVVTDQQSGDAVADGSVKASYAQARSTDEPVHVLAARAELQHDSQIATFHGAPGRPARLWQGASQVDAPVLQFEQRQRRLLAHGEGQGAAMAVHTVLVGGRPSASASSSPSPLNPQPPSNSASPSNFPGPSNSHSPAKPVASRPGASLSKATGTAKADVVRIASRDLVYSDAARKAEFTGGVEVESSDGSMRGQQVVVYLEPAQTGGAAKGSTASATPETAKSAPGSGFMAGSVERVVATGHIEMEQPGRRATGEQVVYTASDGSFLLTGTAAALPKVIDDQRGTVTGTSLRFHSGDDNIVISNGGENGSGQRVRTETRVKNKQ